MRQKGKASSNLTLPIVKAGSTPVNVLGKTCGSTAVLVKQARRRPAL
jgi:hypothetical protein